MQYRAFFSYCRADDQVANWLHRQIDTYRTPRALVGVQGALGAVPDKLHPVFRDRTDMSGGGQLTERIEAALRDSESLIVLCSPAAAASIWVNREVETFLALGRGERIFPVIAAGLPDTGDVELSYFPPALRGRGLLAADLRSIKLPTGKVIGDGRDTGRMKVIAGLLGVALDKIAQRERRRRFITLGAVSATALVTAALATGAIWFALQSAEQQSRAAAEGERAAAAQTNLARTSGPVFAERAATALGAGNRMRAARYALAGWRIAPEHRYLYQEVLTRVLHGEPVVLSHEERPNALLSPDNRHVLTVTRETARFWDVTDGALIRSLTVGENADADFDRTGARFLTFALDRVPRVWDARNGRLVGEIRCACGGDEGGAYLSPTGDRVATTSPDGVLRIWDATGRLDREVRSELGAIRSVSFSPDGARIAAAAGTSALIVSVSDGETLRTLPSQQYDVSSAIFSPGGTWLRTHTSYDGGVRMWRVAGSELNSQQTGNSVLNTSVFSRDERYMATSDWSDTRVQVIDTHDWQVIVRLAHPETAYVVAFNQAGDRLTTSGRDGVVRIWDWRNQAELAHLRGRGGSYSRDGIRIVTVDGNDVLIWDAARASRTMEELASEACRTFLTSMSRRFDERERDDDALIRDVWIQDGHDRDVCENVPGAPPVGPLGRLPD